jgi:plastocyanin
MVRRVLAVIAVAPLVLILGLLSLAAAPVALAGDPCYHGFDVPARWEEATTDIKALPCAFGPTIARVPVGATVTWYNGDDFTHLVTGANQEWGSRDAELKPGGHVSSRFSTPGIYPYACALHRGMSGVVIVTDAAGPTAAAGSPPATTAPAAAAPGRGATGNSSGSAVAVVAIVAGSAVAIVGATIIARRRRPVAL